MKEKSKVKCTLFCILNRKIIHQLKRKEKKIKEKGLSLYKS
jgi:hypothetical protein